MVSVGTVCAESIERNYNLGEVLVSATKTEQYQSEVGSSTTVITSEKMQKEGKSTVLEVLREVPGISVMQYGSLGGSASVYLRGSKPGHTLVMIDGVEMNDPMSTDRSFDFGNLLVDNIERIEIVRGPQSTLYGSDAIGGVINIVTKKGKGPLQCDVFFEGGSFNTFKEKLGISGSIDKMDYSLSVMRMDSAGVSKAANTAADEDDGYENTTVSAKLGYKVFDTANMDLVFRHTDASYDYDDGASQDDPNKTGWWKNSMGSIAFDQAVNDVWDHKLTVSYSKTIRKYLDEPDSVDTTDNSHNWYVGEMKKFSWQHNFYPVDWSTLTGGAEYEEERGFSDGRASWDRFDRKTAHTVGYYLQNQFKLFENLYITPGIRVDDHELFGSETTYKISGSYLIAPIGTRLKANWGTGFKAPSLYQLYSSYGTPTLSPDKSKSYDLGFEQSLFNNKVNFGATYFYNYFNNMVDFDMSSFKYKNIDNAETEGVEFEMSFDPVDNLALGANYTYTRTKDRDNAKALARRPKNQVGLNINWGFIKKANLNFSVNYVGSRFNNASNTVKMKPYTTADLKTSYDITDDVQVFCRAENIFNKTYQQISGYANPGASYSAGVKAKF